MSAITVGGDLVHYEKLGRGRPVILIHGWIGSWRYWIPLMRQLQLKYAVYAVDLFGYGDSAKNPARYSISHQVRLLDSFMQQLAIKKAAIVGHGLGTMVMAQFATQYPDRVARMMLTSAPLFEVPDLKNRPMPDQSRLLTPSHTSNPFPGEDGLDDGPTEDQTLLRRPGGGLDGRIGSSSAADITVQNASRETIVNPSGIDRATLQRAAMQRGSAVLDGDDSLSRSDSDSSRPLAERNANNPLIRSLDDDPNSLLARCFKRSEDNYEKLRGDIAKQDGAAIRYSAESFDAGDMLDTLRGLGTQMVIVHGKQDPIIDPPSPDVWEFLTLMRDEKVVPVQLDNVRHFPMLEYEPFTRMVTSFLETSSLNNLDMKERWRRRTR